MLTKKILLALPVVLFSPLLIFAQIDESFVRDSIEIERGVEGTMDFEPSTRVVNEVFDANNRPLRSVVYNYISATELEPHQQQHYEYNEDGNTTMFLLEQWDAAGEVWVPVKQENSSYNSNGRLSSFVRMVAVQGQLQNRRRWTYQYNAGGRETGKLLEGWNADTETWENISRKITSYTAEGQLSEQSLDRYADDSWVNNRRRMWTYEPGQLQPSQTMGQVWSTTEQAWINDSRKTYGMGINGLWSGSIVEEWNVVTQEWVNDVKETFAIDLVNNSSTYAIERWNDQWVPDARSEYTYSTNQNTALLQRWNAADMAHENFLRYRSLFNDNRLPVQHTGMQEWNAEDLSWQNESFTRRVSYFWREIDPTGTEVLQVASHCLIPNPYWSGTGISCELTSPNFPLTLEIYNVYGQLVLNQQVNSTSFSAETSSLPYGMYVFKLSDERQIYQLQKVVVAN